MGELTEAQAKALEAVVAGQAARFRSIQTGRHDKWIGIRADVARRLIAAHLIKLPLGAGYSYGAQRLKATDEGVAALSRYRADALDSTEAAP